MNYIECQYCEGQGYFTDREELSPWEYTEKHWPCPDCNGTGAVKQKEGTKREKEYAETSK